MRQRVILRRRLIAAAGALAAVVVLLLLLVGGEDSNPAAQAPFELDAVSAEAREIVEELSAEEKIDQVILAGVRGDGGRPEAAGGALIEAASWPGAEAAKQLTDELRGPSGVSRPLIATRQIGGPYRELEDLPPGDRPIEIGDAADRKQALRTAEETAEALADAGIDLNLAPIADVAGLESPIADRAFSNDPAIATALTAATIRGCRRGGIGCAPAHFPGLGAATQDTAAGPANVALDRQTLLSRDLAPFAAAFASGAPAVVVSHAFYSAYDPVTPASLTPGILGGLLRDELGFEGAAITDDLLAGAIQAGYGTGEAARLALAAGADMVQISDPREVEPVRAELRSALEAGELPENRLDGAAARVIELKRKLGVLREPASSASVPADRPR